MARKTSILPAIATAPLRWVPSTHPGPSRCCPYAQLLYGKRFRGARCCAARRREISRLHPEGGLGWADAALALRNASLYFLGDSLAEQHLLSLLCLAWATPGYSVVGLRHRAARAEEPFESRTQARINPTGTRLLLTKTRRTSDSFLLPAAAHVHEALRKSTVAILGGWHHRGSSSSAARGDRPLSTHQRRLSGLLDAVARHRPRAPTLVTEHLPSHFPGGVYRADGLYPGSRDRACAQHGTDARNAQRNAALAAEMRRRGAPRPGLRTLHVSRLYEQIGGVAHVGWEFDLEANRTQRDCVHWCVAPGVLGMLARATLTEVVRHAA